MRNPESCSRVGCSQPVVITFCQEDICLSHFCSDCYELLERFDRGSGPNGSRPPLTSEETLVPNECARAALEISLRSENLNNLERARLLDILLWSGDLTNSFCHARTSGEVRAADRGIRDRSQRAELHSNKARSGVSS
jgi:hypothetical protein